MSPRPTSRPAGRPTCRPTCRPHHLDRRRRVVVALCLAMAVALVPAVPAAATPAGPLPPYARPCPREDSPRCTWDARHRGNGEGRSFISYGRDEPVLHVSHRRAHRLVARWRATHRPG